MLARLRPQERRVIELRFGVGENSRYQLSTDEVARLLKASSPRVSSLCSYGLYKLSLQFTHTLVGEDSDAVSAH